MSAIDEALNDVWEVISELLANDARAELAALRESVATLTAQNAEQARRLEEARKLIAEYDRLCYDCRCDAWLSATAPATSAQDAQVIRIPDEVLGKWVYCKQHRKPHESGWCTVSNRDKLGLGVDTVQEAFQKCKDFGLSIYGDEQSR